MDEQLQKILASNDTDQIEKAKARSSFELIKALQKMFMQMLLSKVSYADPTPVLEAIVDDNGTPISIYEQKDIGEFFLNLLDRLQDGLGENKSIIRKAMNADYRRSSSLVDAEGKQLVGEKAAKQMDDLLIDDRQPSDAVSLKQPQAMDGQLQESLGVGRQESDILRQ